MLPPKKPTLLAKKIIAQILKLNPDFKEENLYYCTTLKANIQYCGMRSQLIFIYDLKTPNQYLDIHVGCEDYQKNLTGKIYLKKDLQKRCNYVAVKGASNEQY